MTNPLDEGATSLRAAVDTALKIADAQNALLVAALLADVLAVIDRPLGLRSK